MSVKRINPLPTLSGVAAGSTATADIPIGPRYHVLWLQVGNTAKKLASEILGDIRLKVNGKVQRTMSAGELDQLNVMMGAEYGVREVNDGSTGTGHIVTSRLPIYLAEPWRKQVAAADGLAWATGNLATFQLEVDIAAGEGTGLVLSAFAELDNSITKDAQGLEQQAPLGVISKWMRQQIPINGTAQDLQSFPRRDHYQQLSFLDKDANGASQACTITKVTIKVENFVIREITRDQNAAILASRGMTQAANRFDVVFDHDDIIDSALPMVVGGRPVQDFQVKLDLSSGTARNITCIAQRIGLAE
jgi:hypothetical protein